MPESQSSKASSKRGGGLSRRIRKAIQASDKSQVAAAAEWKVNRKTVAKWRQRKTASELKKGPKPRSHSLNPAEEAFVVQYRLMTWLTLDDCLEKLREVLPKLTRSALHRCFQRHGIGRLRAGLTTTLAKTRARHVPGRFWISAQRQAGPGAPVLFAGVELCSASVFCRWGEESRDTAAEFLRELDDRHSGRVSEATTDADWLFVASADESRPWRHPFSAVCQERAITHWKTLPSPVVLASAFRAQPEMRRVKPLTDAEAAILLRRLMALEKKSHHRCPLTMPPWDFLATDGCPVNSCGGGPLCVLDNKNKNLYLMNSLSSRG